ncbi:MAG: hypothetical protein ACQESR_31035, partial [Planctomycetota bacterium]
STIPTPTLLTGHYSGSRLESFVEPPYADPHVRWRGGWAGQPARLPDLCSGKVRVGGGSARGSDFIGVNG